VIFLAVHKPHFQTPENSPEIMQMVNTDRLIDRVAARLDNPRTIHMSSSLLTPSAPGVARRIAAMFYDGLLLAALWFSISALLLAMSGGRLADPDRPLWLLVVLRVSLILITVLFFTGFWTHGGQTLGMRAWRLRLVNNSDGPVNWKQALGRFIAAIPSIGVFGLGLLWMLLDPERCALHDRLSGTRLILLAKKP
jgi:uncharacterized RDD family membrane protein YckC